MQNKNSDIEKFLKAKKIDIKKSNNNYQLDCPGCTDKTQRLGIQCETGALRCFNCNLKFKGGDVKKSLRYLDKVMKRAESGYKNSSIKERKKEKQITIDTKLHTKFIKADSVASDYLTKVRGLNKKTLEYFKIGSRFLKVYTKNKKCLNKRYITIPYIQDGMCVNLKYRAVNAKNKKNKWRREKGGKTILFNDAVLNDLSYNSLVLCESEIDTMSLWDAGIKNVVGLTAGADSFEASWFDRLKRFDKIYICLDNDNSGQKGAKALSKRLGLNRCYNVLLPEGFKDPNEYFYSSENKKKIHDKNDFKRLLKKAKKFEVEGVVSTDDMFRDLVTSLKEGDTGYKTPWRDVNSKMGKAKTGQLIVIAGESKMGKSSLALNWQDYLGTNGVPTVYCSYEMNSRMMARNLIRMHDTAYTDIDNITELMALRTGRLIKNKKMQFVYPTLGQYTLDSEIEKLENVIKRYGSKVIFFDNLLFFTRGISGKMSQADKVGMVTQRFKSLAERLDVVFVLLTHPRKLESGKKMGPEDLKESSSIFQDLDNLIILHRDRLKKVEDNFYTYPILAKIDKAINRIAFGAQADLMASQNILSNLSEITVICRWSEGGRTNLYFNGFRGKFTDGGDLFRALTANKNKNKINSARDARLRAKKSRGKR